LNEFGEFACLKKGCEAMGIFDRLRGVRDRRNDPDCPLNVAEARASSLYPRGAKMTVMFRKTPDYPVCRKCTRRDRFNCDIMATPRPTPKTAEKKEEKEKDEEALEGFRALFG